MYKALVIVVPKANSHFCGAIKLLYSALSRDHLWQCKLGWDHDDTLPEEPEPLS